MQKIIKALFVLMLSFSFSNASMVEDGFLELEKGNVLEAANIFNVACQKGAFAGCYNLGLLYFKVNILLKTIQKLTSYLKKLVLKDIIKRVSILHIWMKKVLGLKKI